MDLFPAVRSQASVNSEFFFHFSTVLHAPKSLRYCKIHGINSNAKITSGEHLLPVSDSHESSDSCDLLPTSAVSPDVTAASLCTGEYTSTPLLASMIFEQKMNKNWIKPCFNKFPSLIHPVFITSGIFWQKNSFQEWHPKKIQASYVARDFSELLWLSTSATLPVPPLQGWTSSAVCLAKMARKERVNRVEYIWASEAWLCNSFKPIVHLVCCVYWHPAWLLKRRRGHLSKCFGKISTNHKKSKWSATWSICGDVPSKYPSALFDFQCSAPPPPGQERPSGSFRFSLTSVIKSWTLTWSADGSRKTKGWTKWVRKIVDEYVDTKTL